MKKLLLFIGILLSVASFGQSNRLDSLVINNIYNGNFTGQGTQNVLIVMVDSIRKAGSGSGGVDTGTHKSALSVYYASLLYLPISDSNIKIGYVTPYYLSTHGSSGWSLTGNSGTTPGTNFVGTTDAQDLDFKIGGFEAGRLGYSSGNANWGIVAGNANNGSDNTFIGGHAGDGAAGTFNAGLSWEALRNCTGSYNIGIGPQSGYDITGSYNTVIGGISGLAYTPLVSGSRNTFIGYGTGVNSASAIKRIAVGDSAYNRHDSTAVIGDTSLRGLSLGNGAYVVPVQITSSSSGTVSSLGAQILAIESNPTVLTINAPSRPFNGQLWEVTVNTLAVTVTVTWSNGTFVNAPTTITSSTPARWYFDGSISKWILQ